MLGLSAGCHAVVGEPVDTEPGGKGDNGGNGSGGSGLPAARFLREIGMLQCDFAFSCRASFPDGDPAFVQVFGSTAAACYRDAEAYYLPQVVEEQIASGKIEYHADAAEECLARSGPGASCAEYWDRGTQFDAACDDALEGRVDDGGSCRTIFDCGDTRSACDPDTEVCGPSRRQDQAISATSSISSDAGPW